LLEPSPGYLHGLMRKPCQRLRELPRQVRQQQHRQPDSARNHHQVEQLQPREDIGEMTILIGAKHQVLKQYPVGVVADMLGRLLGRLDQCCVACAETQELCVYDAINLGLVGDKKRPNAVQHQLSSLSGRSSIVHVGRLELTYLGPERGEIDLRTRQQIRLQSAADSAETLVDLTEVELGSELNGYATTEPHRVPQDRQTHREDDGDRQAERRDYPASHTPLFHRVLMSLST
jgi:hypothetical protein